MVITKTDRQTGVGLAGAVFEVKNVNGAVIGRFTTGDGGVVIVPNLVPGAYIVAEVVAPQGFELDSTPQTVQVGAGSGTGATSGAGIRLKLFGARFAAAALKMLCSFPYKLSLINFMMSFTICHATTSSPSPAGLELIKLFVKYFKI